MGVAEKVLMALTGQMLVCVAATGMVPVRVSLAAFNVNCQIILPHSYISP